MLRVRSVSSLALAFGIALAAVAGPVPASAAEPTPRVPTVKPQAKPAAPGSAPAAAQPAAPAPAGSPAAGTDAPVTAATPAGEWYGGPVNGADGAFAYCVVENRFDTGHLLIIAMSPQGELNIGMQIPGANLPRNAEWTVRLTVDGGTERERTAVSTQSDLLVIPQGKDDALLDRLMNGNELLIRSDTDRVAFRLKGTKKALTELKTCVQKDGKVAASRPPAPEKASPLPDALLALLVEAGIRDIAPVPLEDLPADRRPDFLWRAGPVTASVRQHLVDETATLSEISDIYRNAMVSACGGGKAEYGDVEVMIGLTLRTGSLECPSDRGPLHVALLLYLTDANLFTLFTHEAPAGDRALADRMRDRLAAAVRVLAAREFSIDGALGAPAATPKAR